MKRQLGLVAIAAVVAVLSTGCLFGPNGARYAAQPTIPKPWWCTSGSGPDLSTSDCKNFSLQLDLSLSIAQAHPYVSSALGDGYAASSYVSGIGASLHKGAPSSSFDALKPYALLYSGTTAGAQIAGLEYRVTSASAPAGFIGTSDVWTNIGSGVWRLRTWIVRPFENEPNLFSNTHPCLGATAATFDVTAACYTSTHPQPLRILVSNDDGYRAAGIDATVQILRTLSNVEITVSAPATNQSGEGGKTTDGPLTATTGTTLSGYPATAVNGYPADSVIYALDTLHANPDLLVSGINEGQNLGPIVSISGTVGAARRGAMAGIPAAAFSQGTGSPPDYPSGAAALLDWVQRFRLGRAGPPFETVANINIPTCTAGSIRGLKLVPTATDIAGRPYGPSDCTSTVNNPRDDLDAFNNGFTAESDVGLG